jgi:hypothetical protein
MKNNLHNIIKKLFLFLNIIHLFGCKESNPTAPISNLDWEFDITYDNTRSHFKGNLLQPGINWGLIQYYGSDVYNLQAIGIDNGQGYISGDPCMYVIFVDQNQTGSQPAIFSDQVTEDAGEITINVTQLATDHQRDSWGEITSYGKPVIVNIPNQSFTDYSGTQHTVSGKIKFFKSL